jgi:hypothetical protein
MRKVAASPARVSTMEAVTAGLIVLMTVALAAVALAARGSFAGSFGLSLAELAVNVRATLVAVGSGLLALWTTAALPVVVGLSMLLAVSLAALRRSLGPASVRVMS